ncbi:MAG: Dam family site-specific DNA-(adenine-N6)-methyltransferase [Prevotella sp.]|jgi:DNA adenine methylase|nr:Dam family site-specific DNA-(adenine-N6)-methyltransferase [Prevotella sp.]MCH4186619.1 Dam family site-specific DNA-(adenine-N6)-methyltransferase [Prevotella sp.]MCH4216079.1 Dam family site-specific DNA-(adenine-N6)-methyltransferase [Prevotella sp.]MCH4251890.1 Dam family site-specific DNA-(adenine-N6)-methyltransferase [Prevotella sp.]MCI1472991.1 Dam family site-specific DNA-(adenine-N6)-methyltransferase [Prevotella sp.]MCI1518846.1 Dam family site-specific DNA-(adenine-N6)-methyltr
MLNNCKKPNNGIIVPPIKSQGIKTKLVPWINDIIYHSGLDLPHTNWIEPFFGTGVVGLNAPVGGNRYVGDSNPYIINFYNGLLTSEINSNNMRQYLEKEGKLLSNAEEEGYAYYRKVKDRFNAKHSPFDFIFLSRAGFNGMMRFNRHGEWNIPFCKKPNRFAPAYITKICNQIAATQRIINKYHWEFYNQNFIDTIHHAQAGDLIYCDPPYFGRYVDYYNGWTENDEEALYCALRNTPAHFILSTWHHNEFRTNEMMSRYWNNFNVKVKEHFYHSGGHLENRHIMIEALVFNFDLQTESLATQQQKEMVFNFNM